MGLSVFPAPSGGSSSQLPPGATSVWADGNITSATATVTKAMPSGQYVISSPSAVTVTTNGGLTATAVPNVPTTLNVTSAQTSATVVPEYSGTIWSTGTANIAGSFSVQTRAYASTIGRHVAIANGANTSTFAHSTDGLNAWTEVANFPYTSSWAWIAASPTRFVAFPQGNTGQGAWSSDGINWNTITLPTSFTVGYLMYSTVGGLFIAGRSDMSATYYTSPDGTTWTARGNLPSTGEWKFSVANGILFATNASYNTNGAYSTNGTSWTAMTLPTDQNWFKVVHANGVYVATTRYGGPSATSTNGINWTNRTSPTPPAGGSYQDTVAIGGVFLVVYTSPSVAQSTDGINWRYQNQSPTLQVGNGVLAQVGNEIYGITNSSPIRSTKTSAQPYASGQYFSITAGPVSPTY